MKYREAQAVGQPGSSSSSWKLLKKSRYKDSLHQKSVSLGAADCRGAQGV